MAKISLFPIFIFPKISTFSSLLTVWSNLVLFSRLITGPPTGHPRRARTRHATRKGNHYRPRLISTLPFLTNTKNSEASARFEKIAPIPHCFFFGKNCAFLRPNPRRAIARRSGQEGVGPASGEAKLAFAGAARVDSPCGKRSVGRENEEFSLRT